MEPQENKALAIRKAISAHEETVAALADLSDGVDDPRYAAMLERIQRNLADLHALAQSNEPTDKV